MDRVDSSRYYLVGQRVPSYAAAGLGLVGSVPKPLTAAGCDWLPRTLWRQKDHKTEQERPNRVSQ